MFLPLCHRKTLVHHVVQCVPKTPPDPTVTVYQVKHVDKVSLLECDNMQSFYGVTPSYKECVYNMQTVVLGTAHTVKQKRELMFERRLTLHSLQLLARPYCITTSQSTDGHVASEPLA